jgi:class 3 adenylate cyclase
VTFRLLRFAPHYAIEEAERALETVRELSERGLLSNGVYYVVLVDLIASTRYGKEFGNELLSKRVEEFVKASVASIGTCGLVSHAFFVKEIGDATLLLFQHFPDVLRWQKTLLQRLSKSKKQPYEIRTCVHVGEVFLSDGNPVCFAVSELFKLEKSVPSNSVVLTQGAKDVAWPSVDQGERKFEVAGRYKSAASGKPVTLWRYRDD